MVALSPQNDVIIKRTKRRRRLSKLRRTNRKKLLRTLIGYMLENGIIKRPSKTGENRFKIFVKSMIGIDTDDMKFGQCQ